MPSWNKNLMARTHTKAGTILRNKYKQEYVQMVKESGSEAKAQARLQREHRQEYRAIFNEVAKDLGYNTAEMRRAKTIERREAELQRLRSI